MQVTYACLHFCLHLHLALFTCAASANVNTNQGLPCTANIKAFVCVVPVHTFFLALILCLYLEDIKVFLIQISTFTEHAIWFYVMPKDLRCQHLMHAMLQTSGQSLQRLVLKFKEPF